MTEQSPAVQRLSYDAMVEHEGGYFLSGFTSGYDPGDVYYVAHCNHCSDSLQDLGDATYTHSDEKVGRECWDRRALVTRLGSRDRKEQT